MNAIIFDTETTDAGDDAEIIEAAWLPIDVTKHGLDGYGDAYEKRFKPSKPITFGAMAVHHIHESDLEGCDPSGSFALPETVEYLVGHKIDFDWQAAGAPAHVKRICTLAMARKLWPEESSHTLGALMYMLSTDRERTRQDLRAAHSALADVISCGTLLDAIIEKAGPFDSLEALWQFSEDCRVPEKITFGKHAGTAIKDLPTDYVLWFVRQSDVDPYLRVALERRLGR